MAFCGKCGAYIAEGSNVCPACGKRVGETTKEKKESKSQNGSAYQEQGQENDGTYRYTYRSKKQGNAHWSGKEPPDWKQTGRKYARAAGSFVSGSMSGPFPKIAALSYFSFLFLIPYFLRNDSEFARFHANQGLVLFLFNAAINVVGFVPLLGWLVSAAGWVFTIVCIVIGVSNVLNGRFRRLPIIGNIKLLR